ncbi:MAG: ABC transporter substrate-binding protein [Candidatus Dormibacteria bacterium]
MSHSTARLRITVLTLPLVALVLAGCGSATTAATSAPSSIHLAVVGPMSGDAVTDGQHILQGAEIARDQINGAGGIKSGRYQGAQIVIDKFDDTESVDKSVEIARQVVNNKDEWAFLGTGFSDAAIATAPVLDRANVSYLSTYASSKEIIAKPRNNVFVVPPTFPAYAYSAAERAYALGYRHAAVLQANAAFGLQLAQLFRDHFTSLGGTIVGSETYTLGDKNTQGVVATVLRHSPDVIALAGLSGDDAAQLHQLRAAGSTVPVIDTEAVTFGKSFISLAGPDADGLIGQTPSDPARSTPPSRHLRDLYNARFQSALIPDPTAFTYEAVTAVATALESGPSDRTQLARALHSVTINDTGIGRLQFDQGGARLGGTLWYYKINKGSFHFDTGYRQTAPDAVTQTPLEE